MKRVGATGDALPTGRPGAGRASGGDAGRPGAARRRAPTAGERRCITRAGLSAFGLGQHEQAATQFRRALELAYEMDDPAAVIDARFNLAASLAELGRHDEALALLDAAMAESEREGIPVTADLWLLRASVLYRKGDLDAAAAAAARAVDLATPDSGVAARSHFLAGLVAADKADREDVARSLARLNPAAADPRLAADRAELAGRLAALDGDAAGAVQRLGEAARARSLTGDYRAAARALASAGRIAEAAGLRAEAARHYLRAGRSAAARGAADRAREWLGEARRNAESAGDPATADEAEAALAALEG